MRTWLCAVLAGLAAMASAQAAPRPPIVNGTPDTSDPAVVLIQVADPSGDTALCTGTLVAPTKVLTAAHCFEKGTSGEVQFGPSMNAPTMVVGFDRVVVYPQFYDGSTEDVAVVTLEFAVNSVTPLAVQTTPLTKAIVGQTVTAVGFGQTDPNNTSSSGTKNEAQMAVTDLTADDLAFDPSKNAGRSGAPGDSGGPVLLVTGGGTTVLGVCHGEDAAVAVGNLYTRTDAFASWLLAQGIVATPCSTASPCPPGSYCNVGTCVADEVAPCSLWSTASPVATLADGCPAGTACVIGAAGAGFAPSCQAESAINAGCATSGFCSVGHVCAPENLGCLPLCGSPAAGCLPLSGTDQSFLGWAVACTKDSDCPSLAPLCLQNFCGQCSDTSPCPGGGACQGTYCMPENAGCVWDVDCYGIQTPGQAMLCDVKTGHCVGCQSDADCVLGKVCVGQSCVVYVPTSCTSPLGAPSGCGAGQKCDINNYPSSSAAFVCVAAGTGTIGASCTAESGCAAGFNCQSGGLCTPFCAVGDATACGGAGCASTWNSSVGTCATCRASSDCTSASGAPTCDSQTNFCVQCVTNADCPLSSCFTAQVGCGDICGPSHLCVSCDGGSCGADGGAGGPDAGVGSSRGGGCGCSGSGWSGQCGWLTLLALVCAWRRGRSRR